MKIRKIMTKAPSYCTPSCTAEMAANLMNQCDSGILPVVQDSLDLKVLGVVTDRDLCLAVIAARRDPAHTMVNECMSRNARCVGPEDDAKQAVEVMAEHQIRRLPVVNENGKLLGIVSLADIVEQDAVSFEVLGGALKKICAPSRVLTSRRNRAAA
jgi:CBS domain-containing protein